VIPEGTWRRRRSESIEDQIASRLPLFGHLFSLRPKHIQRLTGFEWEGYREYADEWLKLEANRNG
jgi:hypothetical protein